MFPFGFLASGRLVDDRCERFCEARAQLLVVGDLQPRIERLVCQPLAAVVRARVGAVRVGQQPQAVVEERAPTDVLFVVLGEALLDVRESGADAVLVPFERREFHLDGAGALPGRVASVVWRGDDFCMEPGRAEHSHRE